MVLGTKSVSLETQRQRSHKRGSDRAARALGPYPAVPEQWLRARVLALQKAKGCCPFPTKLSLFSTEEHIARVTRWGTVARGCRGVRGVSQTPAFPWLGMEQFG